MTDDDKYKLVILNKRRVQYEINDVFCDKSFVKP